MVPCCCKKRKDTQGKNIRKFPEENHLAVILLSQYQWDKYKDFCILGRENRQKNLRKLYQFIVLQLLGVDAFWVVDGSIDLTNAHTLGPKPVQVPHGVKTHITEALRKVTATSPRCNMTFTFKSFINYESKHFNCHSLLNHKL